LLIVQALVAKESMATMAPGLKVVAHHGAVNSPGFGLRFIEQFDVVLLALDNNEARSFVNKACKALGIFFLDAGSMGFTGLRNLL
jgi:ubiquitin-like 1-activating enzyme E1 B